MKSIMCNVCGKIMGEDYNAFSIVQFITDGEYKNCRFEMDLCPNCRDTMIALFVNKCKHSPLTGIFATHDLLKEVEQ